jgi:hypothetical protein
VLSISLFVSSGRGIPATDVNIPTTTSSAAVCRNGDIVAGDLETVQNNYISVLFYNLHNGISIDQDIKIKHLEVSIE